MAWIGVDLDGTLAYYDGTWRGKHHVGEPIQSMVDRVKQWIAEGREVRIMTARACDGRDCVPAIERWCLRHIGEILEVTNEKDYHMIELWDDRAIPVEKNTGRVLHSEMG